MLKKLETIRVKTYREEIKRIAETILVTHMHDILKKEIKGVNIEVNQDKKAVIQKINIAGLDEKYGILLNEIDDFIYSDSKIVGSGMISNLRSFLGDLFKDLAKEISEKNKEEIPRIDGKKEMGNIRTYLKDKFDLTDQEDNFINNFIGILHSEGGHSFVSDKEYFRLAKNIAIEIALFMLSKYEKVMKK